MSGSSIINSNEINTEIIRCFNYEKYIEYIEEQIPKESINYSLYYNNEIYLEIRQQKTSHDIDEN